MKKNRLVIVLTIFFAALLTYGQTIKIEKPIGGANWRFGTQKFIRWAASGIQEGEFIIFLWKDNAKVGTIARNIPWKKNQYHWDVGKLLESPGTRVRPGKNYRIMVQLQGTSIKGINPQSFVLSIKHPRSQPPPEPGTPTEATPDYRARDLRVDENGKLCVFVQIVPANSPETISFLVGKGRNAATGLTRINKNGPFGFSQSGDATGQWIELIHINALATETDRLQGNTMAVTAIVNQPHLVSEDNYDNNRISKHVKIRRHNIRISLIGNGLNTAVDTLYYEQNSSGINPCCHTDIALEFYNSGYGPATGTILVRQFAGHRPGELADGSRERISLGVKTVTIPAHDPRETYGMGVFGGAISNPQWREGELEIIFGGDFAGAFAGCHQGNPVKLNFRYREL